MRIDSYCHFAPLKLLEFLEKHGREGPHVFRKLFSNVPTLFDERARLRFKDEHGIDTSLLVPLPWLEATPRVYRGAKLAAQAARLANDEIAALVARNGHRFRGVALLPSVNPEVMLAEAQRALDELDAAGFVIFVGPTAKRVDHPDYEPVFKLAHERQVPIWIHPCRPGSYSDYVDEQGSKFLIWQTLGWLFDTSTAMVRLVFNGVFERYPGICIIVHHHGSLIPSFYKRMQTSYDFFEQNTGAKFGPGLQQPYTDHFRKFYCDTATFGFEPLLLQLAVMFFGTDQVLFGTDTPMDALSGEIMTRDSIRSVEALLISPADQEKIFSKNIQGVLARKLPAGAVHAAAQRKGKPRMSRRRVGGSGG